MISFEKIIKDLKEDSLLYRENLKYAKIIISSKNRWYSIESILIGEYKSDDDEGIFYSVFYKNMELSYYTNNSFEIIINEEISFMGNLNNKKEYNTFKNIYENECRK